MCFGSDLTAINLPERYSQARGRHTVFTPGPWRALRVHGSKSSGVHREMTDGKLEKGDMGMALSRPCASCPVDSDPELAFGHALELAVLSLPSLGIFPPAASSGSLQRATLGRYMPLMPNQVLPRLPTSIHGPALTEPSTPNLHIYIYGLLGSISLHLPPSEVEGSYADACQDLRVLRVT